MTPLPTLSGPLTIKNGARFAILASRFNSFIVEHLIAGATDTLQRHGAESANIELIYAPGAFELPLLAQRVAALQRHDGLIAVGAVIRGATPHFDYVAGECIKGLHQVSLNSGLPIGLGVLTVDTLEQAIERAGSKAGNKGAEAALAVIEMVNVLAHLHA